MSDACWGTRSNKLFLKKKNDPLKLLDDIPHQAVGPGKFTHCLVPINVQIFEGQVIVPLRLNEASSDQTALLTNPTSLSTLLWNHSQNCTFWSLSYTFMAFKSLGMWTFYPALFKLRCTLAVLTCLMSNVWVFWWSWKLLQHHSRKAWTDWCVRSPRLLLGQGMHETLSLKSVMTAFILKLCWRFCCKFIQQLPWTPHTFSNFQYIFKITLHCTKVKHFATILFPTLNSWSNAGVPVTGTIFWMNVTLHQVNYILVPQKSADTLY